MNKEVLAISKIKIEEKINQILDNEIGTYKDNEFIKSSLEELKRLSSGGKRVRGFLVKLGQLLFGIDDDSFIDVAAALEIFQTAILIHDDIIDKADKRRGMETINSKYEGHLGISKGICIGDLGFFISYKIISELNIDSNVKAEIMKVYARTLYNTVNGEIIDVELPLENMTYHKGMNEKVIYDIYVNKTAWYTIIGPILIGASFANINEKDKQAVIDIGTNLGIAFQIKDDLLGLYSDVKTMGKTLNDIKEGKQTIIYKYAIDNCSLEDLELINKYYGKEDITPDANKIIVELFEKIGARKNAEELVTIYTNKAIKIINESSLLNKELFIDFADYLLKRTN